jgi:PAS domain S-box-containing protein
VLARETKSERGVAGALMRRTWGHLGPDASPMSLVLILTGSILALDLYLPPGRAVTVLFVLVIIVAGAWGGARFVLLAVVAGGSVTIGGYFLRHGWVFNSAYVARRLFSVASIVATGLLVLRNQTVQRRRRELAALLDLTGDAMFARSIDGRITWWNRQAERMYGWSRNQVLGREVGEVLGDGNEGHDSAAIAELTRNGAWQGELRHRLRRGGEIDVLTRWALRTDPSGRPLGILETNTDISQEKAAEAKLRQSEDRHRQIFETGGAAMWELDHTPVMEWYATLQAKGVTDLEGHLRNNPAAVIKAAELIRYVDVNQTALTLLQAKSKDQLRQFVRTVFEAEGVILLTANLAARAAGRQSFSARLSVTTLQGETRTVLISAALPTALFPHLISCWIDVTEQRQTEARLRLVQEELAVVARVATLGELTSSIAQDVDLPIAEIGRHAKTALEVLHMSGSDMVTVCEAIGQVVSEGRHAADIIAGVRDFLRRSTPAQAATELNAIVKAALVLTRHEIADRQIALQVNLAPCLPMLEGDGPRLEHVAVNLILHAIEAMQSLPSEERLLVIETDLQEAEVIMRVKNNGGLCPSAGLDRLFQPVFPTRSDDTRWDIGLAVCRASVEAHRGRIWATPVEPHGMMVHVALPAPG